MESHNWIQAILLVHFDIEEG